MPTLVSHHHRSQLRSRSRSRRGRKMGEVLLEVEGNLRSRKEQLTLEEENFFHKYKSNAVWQFMTGVIAGGGLAWAATMKLHTLFRLNLSAGAGSIFGFWRFYESLNSSADHILTLDGSRMQIELVNAIVKKYPNDPRMMGLISKHFYLEEVFDDSSLEQRFRWRYRNYYSDQGAHDDSKNDSQNATASDSHNNFDSRKTDLRPKQIPVNSGVDMMADPLDLVFGYTTTVEETRHSSNSSTPSRAQSRANKRANRRRRLRHREDSLHSNDE